MKRPDYRTLQALDAVIRERGFERAAQKLCITTRGFTAHKTA